MISRKNAAGAAGLAILAAAATAYGSGFGLYQPSATSHAMGGALVGKAMEEARTVLARTANPQMADLILDQACFEEMKEAAREAECPFLENYVRLLIDSTNLKSAVRTLRMKKDALPSGSRISGLT